MYDNSTIFFSFFLSFVSSRFLSVRFSGCHCQARSPNSMHSFIHFYRLLLLSRCCNLQHWIHSTQNIHQNWLKIESLSTFIEMVMALLSMSIAYSPQVSLLLFQFSFYWCICFHIFAAHVLFMREHACVALSLSVCVCVSLLCTQGNTIPIVQLNSSKKFK